MVLIRLRVNAIVASEDYDRRDSVLVERVHEESILVLTPGKFITFFHPRGQPAESWGAPRGRGTNFSG